MNTAHLIPFQSVVPIVLRSDEHPKFPFFGGTGFFVYFPPYKGIYFVTARHCLFDQSGASKGHMEIKLTEDPNCTLAVPFSEHLTVLESAESSDYEDIVVCTVGQLPDAERIKLFGRSLRLPDQSAVSFLLSNLVDKSGKVRTVGYPGASKKIEYEINRATVQPRGIVGTVTGKSNDEKWVTVEDLNWKGDEISGFSGSPVIEFARGINGVMEVIPIGVLLTGAKNEVFKFATINLVTDLIAARINELGAPTYP